MSAPNLDSILSISTLQISTLQDEVATALRYFYAFLTKLPWLDPRDVLEPPAAGWPNINHENFAPFGKTDQVIELLKHLPYIRMDGPRTDYRVGGFTYFIDYRRDYFQKIEGHVGNWEVPDTEAREFNFPPWVIPLTHGKNLGEFLMLDTTDGTARCYVPLDLRDPAFPADDIRSWRNHCVDPASNFRLGDILNEWKLEYIRMDRIGRPTIHQSMELYFVDYNCPKYEEMKAIMLRFGWPDSFDREGCRNAMLKWDEEDARKVSEEIRKNISNA